VKQWLHVDPDWSIELCFVNLMTWRGLHHDACVVHNDVELSEAVERGLERFVPYVDQGNITCDWYNFAIRVGLCNLFDEVGVDIYDNNFCAFGIKLFRYSWRL
jgi:hypothetical protein